MDESILESLSQKDLIEQDNYPTDGKGITFFDFGMGLASGTMKTTSSESSASCAAADGRDDVSARAACCDAADGRGKEGRDDVSARAACSDGADGREEEDRDPSKSPATLT